MLVPLTNISDVLQKMLSEFYKIKEQDRIGHCFRSDGYIKDVLIKTDDGKDFPIDALPPFLRTLMITDGTVTKNLEAYYWEPIIVETLDQHLVETEHDMEWLQSVKSEKVLVREVRLYGKNSGNIYATAYSVIRQQLLPEGLRQDLLAKKIGIGVLLRDSGLETYREILNIGIKTKHRDVINLAKGEISEFSLVYRTYRINIHHEPVILITEKFPLSLYSEE